MGKRKDPAAVTLGRRGGKKGGKARWEGVPAEERSRQMRALIQGRWAKQRKRKPQSAGPADLG
jgi:hypothetical protein